VLHAIGEGFSYPIGHGLGATTLASSKFGSNEKTGSSEVDFSDMFISLGALGGLLYLFVIWATAREALEYTKAVKRSVSLPVLAVLTCTLASWLIGGQYSTASLVFFLIGGLVYEKNRVPEGNRVVTR
jgi:hypothetical protein